MPNILIIDDDEMLCDLLCRHLTQTGYAADHALSLREGLSKATSGGFDVVFLDVHLPDGDGLDALPRLRAVPSSPEVVIFTGDGDPDGAEVAIRSGAWDYIEKPLTPKGVTLSLIRALQYRGNKNKKSLRVALKREGIIGRSPKLERCLDLLAEAANSDMNVLITGDTGTGKELFARGIHENSPRAAKSFVVVDCTALPETLVESMLFGYEKGAFTGADKAYVGLIKQADGGTLFLDEVGELPLSLQKPFLRVLQERRFRPLASNREVESDFRLLSATNRNLNEMARSGRFREDLLFRIRSTMIELPSLRNRGKDINEIAIYFLGRFSERYGSGTKGLSPEFIEALSLYSWPGNVRELFNTMEGALAASTTEPVLFPKHLPTHLRIQLARASVRKGVAAKDSQEKTIPSSKSFRPLREFRDAAIAESENQYLRELMLLTGRDMAEACRVSGLSRSRLYHLLQKYEVIGIG